MLRISINWTFVSPVLRVSTGILKVEFQNKDWAFEEIFRCKVRKEQGTIGYSGIPPDLGVPADLFEALRPTINTMVRAYWDGMILEKSTYEWVEDSADLTFEEWKEKRGVTIGKNNK